MIVRRALIHEIVALGLKHTYFRTMSVVMVRAMATREIDTPTLLMISRDSTTGAVKLGGAALSKMAKCVR